jgi:hypothetical protein
MPYEQIQSGLRSEEDKREALKRALLSQMQGFGDTQMVSGRAVPNSPITGITKIIEALINKGALGESEAATKELLGQQGMEKQAAISDVMSAFQGTPAFTSQESAGMLPGQMGDPAAYAGTPVEQAVVEGDPMKAALLASSSPYTEDMSSILSASAKGGSTPYYKPIYGKGGEILTYDTRTGTMEPTEYIAGRFDPETKGAVKGAEEQAKQDVQLVMEPQKVAAIDLAEREAEKIINKPKIESGLAASEAKTGMLDETIDKAKEQTGAWTTGLLGASTGWVPGTPAHDLGKTLDTVRSNIGFDKLQEMRANSPTGGALGQVSEMENKLLQSVWSSVEQSQSQDQLNENLEKVRRQVKESWDRIKAAYKKEYGVDYDDSQPAKTAGSFDDEKERRYQEWKARQ